MEYVEHEKGAKPSTRRDYRRLLAEPGQLHQRGSRGLRVLRFRTSSGWRH